MRLSFLLALGLVLIGADDPNGQCTEDERTCRIKAELHDRKSNYLKQEKGRAAQRKIEIEEKRKARAEAREREREREQREREEKERQWKEEVARKEEDQRERARKRQERDRQDKEERLRNVKNKQEQRERDRMETLSARNNKKKRPSRQSFASVWSERALMLCAEQVEDLELTQDQLPHNYCELYADVVAVHYQHWGKTGGTQGMLANAMEALRDLGVKQPGSDQTGKGGISKKLYRLGETWPYREAGEIILSGLTDKVLDNFFNTTYQAEMRDKNEEEKIEGAVNMLSMAWLVGMEQEQEDLMRQIIEGGEGEYEASGIVLDM